MQTYSIQKPIIALNTNNTIYYLYLLAFFGRFIQNNAKSPKFEDFVRNSAFKQSEQQSVLSPIRESLDAQTNSFIDSILANRTFNLLPDMIARYNSLVSMLSLEESIKVISAATLSADQQKQVEGALTDRLGGSKYSVKYEVDASIVGGLQIYFGDSFLDCSLATRLARVSNEVESMTA